MSMLFRRQAVDHQRRAGLGRIVLRHGRAAQLGVLAVTLIVVGLLAAFFCLGFARSQTLQGVLTPTQGMVAISSPQAGVVVAIRAAEGQGVAAGRVLFVLSAEHRDDRQRPTARAASVLAERERLAVEAMQQIRTQGRMQQQALAQSMAGMQARLTHLDGELAVLRRRQQLTEAIEQRYRTAMARGLVSQQFVDEKMAESMDQRARTLALERDRMALAEALAQAREDLRQLQPRQREQLLAADAALQQARRERIEQAAAAQWEVRAPCAGRLALRPLLRGQAVAAGQRLADVVPASTALDVVLYAPSQAVGLTRPGMPVQLRFDALPYQHYGQFAGRVVAVARMPEPAAAGVGAAAEPLYRVRVRLAEGAAVRARLGAVLRPGMPVQGTLKLEWRRFAQWAFEPLADLRGGAR
ncbi:HlyD family efflux transporter periplasmic adaptor subunit [Xanthomonas translucens]|uniref:HlyD family efflux transporter periplasmic adaptor subunit n=1 Tax=Xanthomonas campestris pv. translucens TaxID=343 RepID=UPI0018787398